MKKFAALLMVLALAAAANATNPVSLGYSDETITHGPQGDACATGTLYVNHDGTFENGYAWRYAGIAPPYYGAFAEGYDLGPGTLACAAMWFSHNGTFAGQTCDVYVWDSDGVNPTNVLGVVVGFAPSGVGFWPNITQHDCDVNVYCPGDFFVGFWGNWPGVVQGWFIAADLDGFGGLPRTNIAPGIGYPTGWQDPSIVWGPTQSMGLGGYFGEGGSPAENQTWGSIKALFE
jgi:hypothetical protein